MKIYLVTTGEYSDYQVQAACSTRDRAVELSKFLLNANDILELELDQLRVEADEEYVYAVTFNAVGDVVNVRFNSYDWEERVYEDEADQPGWLTVNVIHRGFEPDKVKKIAVDRRAEYLAKRAGI